MVLRRGGGNRPKMWRKLPDNLISGRRKMRRFHHVSGCHCFFFGPERREKTVPDFAFSAVSNYCLVASNWQIILVRNSCVFPYIAVIPFSAH